MSGSSPVAEALALEPGPVVCFELEHVQCALPLRCIGEILRVPVLTDVPGAPSHVRGVIGTPSAVVTVFDLAACVGLRRHTLSEQSRILLLPSPAETLGLLVGVVIGVRQLPRDRVRPASGSQPACGLLPRCLLGRIEPEPGTSPIWLLDAARLIA